AFIRLSDGTVLGKPTPATPENAIRVLPLPTRKPKNLRPTPVVIEAKPSATGSRGASVDPGQPPASRPAAARPPAARPASPPPPAALAARGLARPAADRVHPDRDGRLRLRGPAV